MPQIPPTPSSIHALSAFLYVMLALSGVGAAVFHWPVLTWAGVGCTVAFLVLQFRNVPRFQAIMALVMIAIGLSVGSQSEKVADVLVDGLIKAQLFLVLFFAVAWLQIPAADSPALRAVRRTVVSQPPGWRFSYLVGAGHILGSVLNIAGLVLLSTMVERQTDAGLQRRMASALMQGFVAASIWSPFYVSVIVVLIALPELDWSDAIFHGLPIAAVTVACAWIFDRVVHRRPPPGSSLSGNPQPPGYPLGMRHRINLAGVLGALVVVVVGTVELSGLSLPVVLALVAPPFGVVWMTLLAGPAVAAGRSAAHLAGVVFDRLPGLRNEALAFTAASVFGIGVAAGMPADALGMLSNGGALTIAGLVFGVVGLGLCGLHPVIPVIFIGEALPPDVIGLPAETIGMALLGAWGLSTLVSPVSGTTLMMSKFVGISSHTIAWRWNTPYALVATTVVSLSVIAAWRMHLY